MVFLIYRCENGAVGGLLILEIILSFQIYFVISCPLQPVDSFISQHIAHHGDGVRDVAFRVSDARVAYAEAMKRGAVSVAEPHELKDEHGNQLLQICPLSKCDFSSGGFFWM